MASLAVLVAAAFSCTRSAPPPAPIATAEERIVAARNRYNDLGSQWSGLMLPDAGDVAGRHRRERLRGLLREHADILQAYERLLEEGFDGGVRGPEARLRASETRIQAELTAIRRAEASANGRSAPRRP